MVGTYRPVDVIVQGHALLAVKRELSARGLAEELPLELLTEAEVARYLASRAPSGSESALDGLARALHRRTDGHPLFMVTVVDALARREQIGGESWNVAAAVESVGREVPESLRPLIEEQIDSLEVEDRDLLEAASASGPEWPVPIVAAALEDEIEAVERRGALLARRGLLVARGAEEWPDGTLAMRYAFLHALHQQVCYERLAPTRRAQLHGRIGTRFEAAYGERAGEDAAELAEHFERGRDAVRAVRYRRKAARAALGRWAYHEAIDHLTRSLDGLQRLADTPARIEQELDVLVTLGPALIALHGQAAPEVADVYARARELAHRLGDSRTLFAILHGLRRVHTGQNDHRTALELGEEMLRLAQGEDDRALLLEAHFAIGISRFQLGEQAVAYEHLSRGSVLDDGRPDIAHIARYGGHGTALHHVRGAVAVDARVSRRRTAVERAGARAHA